MYPNFNAELARNGFSKRVLADVWGCREATVYDKLNGKSPITVSEILLARNKLFPNVSIDYLVAQEGEMLCKR
ncbi:MAG: XRE family transcriptional regulator [Lysinibacillus sp.]